MIDTFIARYTPALATQIRGARGKSLPDPTKRLKGSGSQIRHVVLTSPKDLDLAPIRALIAHAMKPHAKVFPSAPKLTTVIRSISAKQRPRRPLTSTARSSPRG